jgi:hypothetical protein
MEAMFSSETSVDFRWTRRYSILQDRALNNHLRVILKTLIV